MSASYSGDPSSSPKDSLRFVLGDTDSTDMLLTDEELNYTLTKYTSEGRAAIASCKAIIAKLAKECDNKLGPAEVKASQRVSAYTVLLKELSKSCGMNAPSGTLMMTTPHETIFSIDMMDNNG